MQITRGRSVKLIAALCGAPGQVVVVRKFEEPPQIGDIPLKVADGALDAVGAVLELADGGR
jgi:hypothetical protein